MRLHSAPAVSFKSRMKRLVSWSFVVVFALAASGAADDPNPARGAFLHLIDRPKVPLAPEWRELGRTNGILTTHFVFHADAAQTVPGLWLSPSGQSGPGPAVIVLHGTGGNKEGQIGLLNKLARAGFVAVAIDGRYHGERTAKGSGSAEYQQAILRAYQTGQEHPFIYDTVWDVMRLLDLLSTRSEIDSRRIGLIGFSKGGMETYLAAAVDERIAAAVPCIGVQSFKWALDHDAWQSRIETIQKAVDEAAAEEAALPVAAGFIRKFYDRVAPGIYGQFDGPAMLPLIAPRPLLVINGASDKRTPLPGLEMCIQAAQRAYDQAGVPTRLVFHPEKNTGHQVLPAEIDFAIQWFRTELHPVPAPAHP